MSDENSESSVAFVTLGCKVNQYETQVMREALRKQGYRMAAPGDAADVYVINTCTVTGVSDRKARQMIRRAVAGNPDALVVVTGCYVERCPDEVRKMPGVGLVLTNWEKVYIGEYLREFEGIEISPDGTSHDKIPPNPPLQRGEACAHPLQRGETSAQTLQKGGISVQPPQGGGIAEKHSEPCHSERSEESLKKTPPSRRFFAPLRMTGATQDFEEYLHPHITTFDGQTRALVKIQDGCDSFCTYCIVPHVRGGEIRSRPVESIVSEVRALAENGHREVVLTGIHLGAYGKELTDGTTLTDVIRAVHDVSGVGRIRLSSIEPMDVSDDLIREMARLPKCAHHFHVSLQSGSDRILKLMRRGYTSAEFEDIVSRIRTAMPDAGLSTDVMVGFPGETEGDFRDTCDLISRVKFSRLHVFRFSPRSGTPAAKFPDRVRDSVASRRSQEVRELGDRLAREFHSRMLGQIAEVLMEDSREGKDRLLAGFTSNYVRVLVADAADDLAGQIIKVKLLDLQDEYMIGLSNF